MQVCDVDMKIHRKILTHFQACDSPVDKEGYLYKKGERNTSYQKRWFVLKGNLLFYKDCPADRELLGVVVVEGCSVELCESEEQFAFSLVWSEPGLRTYKLAADDQESQESWIKALHSANHGYLALLVMDLESLYREAAARALSRDPARSSTMPSRTAPPAPGPPAWLNAGSRTFPQYPGAGLGAAPGFSSSHTLQAPPISSKPANRRSPKLWPKRNANVVPINGPAAPRGEWCDLAVILSGTKEEFSQLHEDYGQEVKELMADWSRRKRGEEVDQGEDLINFG